MRLGTAFFAAVAFLASAAPAHATLSVASDSVGLKIADKNGLNDNVGVTPFFTTSSGTGYTVTNSNSFDVFKFEFLPGCRQFTNEPSKAICARNTPNLSMSLRGGDDSFSVEFALVTGTASIAAGSGNDSGVGGPNRDVFTGEDGNDRFRAGNGRDTLRGDAGNDTLNSKEASGSGVADEIGCGSGSDSLVADSVDSVPSTCEEFEQSPVGETPHVRINRGTLRVRPSGVVRVRLRCPRGVGSLGCKGRLSLRLDRRGARRARKRYEIRAGRSKTVTVRLSRGSVRALRSRQRRGRRTRAILASVERGRKGRKTTVRNPRLRLR